MSSNRKKIAIVGGGIAGLGCAHFLQHDFDITLFEKDRRIGGHVNTVDVVENDSTVPVDTGFMVFNRVTYPNFTRLLDNLQADVKATDMSFSVQHEPLAVEWSGTGLKRFFAKPSNAFNARLWRFAFAVNEFNQKARQVLSFDVYDSLTLEDFAKEMRLNRIVLDLYLLPMMSALWSAPPESMLKFPISLLVRFLYSHGLLSIYDKLSWYTINGGARSYVKELSKPFRNRIKLDTPVKAIRAVPDGVTVLNARGESERFDKCILACHADQSVRMLDSAFEEERALLAKFPYQRNTATLHTDSTVMPDCRGNWASWNYRIKESFYGTADSTTHYWMNSLQGVSKNRDYFVTIDKVTNVRDDSVIREIEYEHPVFSVSSLKAQEQIRSQNTSPGKRRVLLCGSYSRYGFHEDAFTSAINACQGLLGRSVWS